MMGMIMLILMLFKEKGEVEPEEKDLMNISQKDALASDTLDHGEECEEKKEKLVTQKI